MSFEPPRTMDGAIIHSLGSGYVYVTGHTDRGRIGAEPGSVHLAFAYPSEENPEPACRVMFIPDNGLNRMVFAIGFEPVLYWVIRMIDDNSQAARMLIPHGDAPLGSIRKCTLTIDLSDHLALMR